MFLLWLTFLTDWNTKKISLKVEMRPLTQVLEELVGNYQIPIIFQPNQTEAYPVTADLKNRTIDQVLDFLLETTPFTWEKIGSQIVLTKAKAQSKLEVVCKMDQEPIANILIRLKSKHGSRAEFRVVTNLQGIAFFDNLDAGLYLLQAEGLAIERHSQLLQLHKKSQLQKTIEFQPKTLEISELILVPGGQTVLNNENVRLHIMPQDEIEKLPHFGDDAFRLVEQLPGVSKGDMSAEFTVRGGHKRDIMIEFDGAELIDPFHLKVWGGGLTSVINSEILDEVQLMPGNFPTNYGNKKGGVLSLVSGSGDQKKHSVSVDVGGAKIHSQGSLTANSNYLVSLRHSVIDFAYSFASTNDLREEQQSNFDDLYVKWMYFSGNTHHFSFHALATNDYFKVREYYDNGPYPDGRIPHDGGQDRDKSQYYWTNVDSFWTSELSSNTTLLFDTFSIELKEEDTYGTRQSIMDSKKSFEHFKLKHAVVYEPRPQLMLEFGGSFRRAKGNFDYYHHIWDQNPFRQNNVGTRDLELREEADFWGFFASQRMKVNQWSYELGVRYDQQSHTEESQWSPRLNLRYDINNRHHLRFGLGHFAQPHDIHELHIEDGQTQFQNADEGKHWGVNYSGQFGSNTQLECAVYYQKFDINRSRYENFLDSLKFVGVLDWDRIEVRAEEAKSKGFELQLRGEYRGWDWSGNYTYSETLDIIDGLGRKRYWDQPHGLNIRLGTESNNGWGFNVAWYWHSGWLVTPFVLQQVQFGDQTTYQVATGALYSERVNPYHRMDARIHYKTHWRRIEFRAFLDLFNAYNHNNVRGTCDLNC